MDTPTFSEIYCAQHGIPADQFSRAVFKEILYRRAVPLVGALRFLKRNYFSADFDLIYAVEGLRRLHDFHNEARRFNEHPANRGWLRRGLRLRISTSRLKRLIKTTLLPYELQTGSETVSAAPFKRSSSPETMPLTSRS